MTGKGNTELSGNAGYIYFIRLYHRHMHLLNSFDVALKIFSYYCFTKKEKTRTLNTHWYLVNDISTEVVRENWALKCAIDLEMPQKQ